MTAPDEEELIMTVRVGINGFGRIGRSFFRALLAQGSGAGHGVGLCQWGAVGRSRAGHDYRRIVAAYYPGTTLERLY